MKVKEIAEINKLYLQEMKQDSNRILKEIEERKRTYQHLLRRIEALENFLRVEEEQLEVFSQSDEILPKDPIPVPTSVKREEPLVKYNESSTPSITSRDVESIDTNNKEYINFLTNLEDDFDVEVLNDDYLDTLPDLNEEINSDYRKIESSSSTFQATELDEDDYNEVIGSKNQFRKLVNFNFVGQTQNK